MTAKTTAERGATTEEWTMPDWMEPYRELFRNTGGNSIENLINDTGSNTFNNPIRAAICVAVESQAGLLMALHKRGLLVDQIRCPDCDGCGFHVEGDDGVGSEQFPCESCNGNGAVSTAVLTPELVAAIRRAGVLIAAAEAWATVAATDDYSGGADHDLYQALVALTADDRARIARIGGV